MIKQFTLNNFKSFQDAALRLSPLTLMVGANASGKSNALEAIRFLSWLAQGQKLTALQYEVNQHNRVVRGTSKDMFYNGGDTFSIGCEVSGTQAAERYNDGLGSISLRLSFDLRNGEELHISAEECVDWGHDFIYRTAQPTKGFTSDIKVEYNNYSRGGKKPQIVCTDQQPIFTQLGTPSRFDKGHKKSQDLIPLVSNGLSRSLAEIIFLDPRPSMMREPSNKQEKRMHENGQNVSAVLYHLWEHQPDSREVLLSFIQSLPEQHITGLKFLDGLKNDVLLQVEETFGGVKKDVDTSLLSDGTLRVLAIAGALLSAPQGSMVIIEELDNGIHPSRTKNLLEQMYRLSEQRGLTVLISSHNPALMDAMPRQLIPNVVFCYRHPKDGGSKLVQLAELNRYPELIAQGTLGDLVTEGTLERFAKNPQSEEDRKLKGKEWLSSIK